MMRSAKNTAFGQYDFNQIVNTDPKKLELEKIQNDIKAGLIRDTNGMGIDIIGVGINTLGVPTECVEAYLHLEIYFLISFAYGCIPTLSTLIVQLPFKA